MGVPILSNVTYHTDEDNLRIWDIVEHFPNPTLIEFMDFTTIGLVAEPAVYGTGGIKLYQEYWDDDDNWVVRKNFSYRPDGLLIQFEWADKEGNTGLSKTEFKPLNKVEIAKLHRANRERTILYLQASAADTAAAPLITAIIRHYKYQIDLWILNETDDLVNAIRNEPEYYDDKVTPNPIYYYLHVPTVPPSERFPNGLMVKSSILYQVAGVFE